MVDALIESFKFGVSYIFLYLKLAIVLAVPPLNKWKIINPISNYKPCFCMHYTRLLEKTSQCIQKIHEIEIHKN